MSRKNRVLIQDRTTVHEVYKFFLDKLGYDVHTISPVEDLETAAEYWMPDLVILSAPWETFTPGSDWEKLVVDFLQKNEIPYFVCNGGNAEVPPELTGCGTLRKPFGINELQAFISKALPQ